MRLLKHNVFIVDDDPDDRESIRDAFLENKHNHEYIFMKDGVQLLNHLETENDPDDLKIILLDLNMPGKDGKEVLKEIKTNKTWQPIPVIVLTTSSSEKDRDISYELGANCFLTKPSSYKELVDVTDSIARLWMPEGMIS
ncbi:MAG: response regulator [Bacteroidetes bacterium]|nr:response regulator [Bacteroidota bacterium]